MGLLLLRDGMLNSVLAARDKWLSPGGSLFPSHCQLFLAPTHFSSACAPTAGKAASHAQVMQEWSSLVQRVGETWGVDYSCLTSALEAEKDTYHLQTAIEDILGGGGMGGDDVSEFECEMVEVEEEEEEELLAMMAGVAEPGEAGAGLLPSRWTAMRRDDLLGQPVLVKSIDCNTVTVSELEALDCDFYLEVGSSGGEGGSESQTEQTGDRGGGAATSQHHGSTGLNSLTCWFDVQFNGSPGHPTREPVTLSTGPAAPPTHWGQQTFMFPGLICTTTGVKRCTLEGRLRICRLPTTHRMYSAQLSFRHSLSCLPSCGGEPTEPISQQHCIDYSIA